MTDNVGDERVVSRGRKPILAAQIHWRTRRRLASACGPACLLSSWGAKRRRTCCPWLVT